MIFTYPILILHEDGEKIIRIPDLGIKRAFTDVPLHKILLDELRKRENLGKAFRPPSEIADHLDSLEGSEDELIAVRINFEPRNRYRCMSRMLIPIFWTGIGLETISAGILSVGALEVTQKSFISMSREVSLGVSMTQAALTAVYTPFVIKFAAGTKNLPYLGTQIDSFFFRCCHSEPDEEKESLPRLTTCAATLVFLLKLGAVIGALNYEWVDLVDDYQETWALVALNTLFPDWLSHAAGWTNIVIDKLNEVILAASILSLFFKLADSCFTPSPPRVIARVATEAKPSESKEVAVVTDKPPSPHAAMELRASLLETHSPRFFKRELPKRESVCQKIMKCFRC